MNKNGIPIIQYTSKYALRWLTSTGQRSAQLPVLAALQRWHTLATLLLVTSFAFQVARRVGSWGQLELRSRLTRVTGPALHASGKLGVGWALNFYKRMGRVESGIKCECQCPANRLCWKRSQTCVWRMELLEIAWVRYWIMEWTHASTVQSKKHFCSRDFN